MPTVESAALSIAKPSAPVGGMEHPCTSRPKRAARAGYMRQYRAKSRATAFVKKPAPTRELDGTTSCPLCFECFDSGTAYFAHFKARRFGPGETHECMSREEMRESPTLAANWETGSWKEASPATVWTPTHGRGLQFIG